MFLTLLTSYLRLQKIFLWLKRMAELTLNFLNSKHDHHFKMLQLATFLCGYHNTMITVAATCILNNYVKYALSHLFECLCWLFEHNKFNVAFQQPTIFDRAINGVCLISYMYTKTHLSTSNRLHWQLDFIKLNGQKSLKNIYLSFKILAISCIDY